ncbi:MAG: phosphoribosylamine--glycine ligase [Salibacteraceae bacterium]
METINVLVLGAGGREHALAWKIAQSPHLGKLYVAPGNAGTAKIATNISIGESDFGAVERVVREHQIHLLVVGPEAPLVAGIREYFAGLSDLKHLRIVGPDKAGAMLEGSKAFSKAFMQRNGIPTARYKSFDTSQVEEARDFLNRLTPPYVLKADGLAAGKGVVIAEDFATAVHTLDEMLKHGKFGPAGNRVVIEEFLSGTELSVFVLTDGLNYILLPEAKDYKRIGEGDTGPNTGGMGSVSPVPFFDEAFRTKVKEQIIEPTIRGLKREKIPYIGFIFFGLINVNGSPYVIEYNCRMGDPETQSVLPRIKTDLLPILWKCAGGDLSAAGQLQMDERTVASVVAVSGGYPGNYEKGKEIQLKEPCEDCIIFHAGTKLRDGAAITSGGRVLAATCYGKSLDDALQGCYNTMQNIRFGGMYYRKDIGSDLL